MTSNSGWDKAWIAPHDICPDCNGCGWDNPAQALYKCERCGGSGGVSDATIYAGERIEDQIPVSFKWQCIRCQRTFTPTPTDPDQTAYAVETKNGKLIGEICRPCYERDDQPHAPDGDDRDIE